MQQWVLLLAAVLAATLLPDCAAADDAGQLYAAVLGGQQRVQLGPGSTAVLHDGHLDLKQPLAVLGTAGRPATIRCGSRGPHAFVVR